ncbi:MAG TPA: efflux RND transporter periplasmic adaptor subunit [Polyangiaceae bacterium]|jgi:RND family efflux transporter MFP subunit|nr:efflux RND transporter periplasmic adaptor subunit [Polyangiaceae bacterium]
MPDQLSSDLASLKIDRTVRPKGKSPVGLIIGVVLALGAAGAAYQYGLPLLESAVFKTEVEVTEVITVSPAQASVELTSTGYVVAQVSSAVAAKVAGKVKVQAVKQGAKVKAGDLLLEIDTADQQAAIASAESQVAAARARVATAKANLLDMEQQTRRAQTLSDAGIGPKGTAEDLVARSASLKAQVAAAEADAKAQAALSAQLRVNLSSYKIFAPISGTVVNKPPQVGEFIGPQPAGIAIDMGGVTIADFGSLMVETDVPEQRLSQVKMGGPAEIVMDAFPTKRYRGKAVEVTPKVNRVKATVTVKVAFVDENEGVLPDMAARVSFLTNALDKEAMKAPPKTVVPGSAVVDVQGAKAVYRIEGGVVRLTTVTLGPAVGSGFEVVSGVTSGTRVVSNPPQGLADGQRIKERNAR